MDKIFINGLKVNTIIGIYPKEKVTQQAVILDIKLYCKISKAAMTDDINYAIDYHKISEDIYTLVEESRFELIETLAETVTQKLLSYSGVKKVWLKLSKPEALDKAKNVGLIIKRK